MPIAACFYGPDRAADGRDDSDRVPVYDAVDAAAESLGRLATYAEWLALSEGAAIELDADDAAAAREIVQAAILRGEATLDLAETAAPCWPGQAWPARPPTRSTRSTRPSPPLP